MTTLPAGFEDLARFLDRWDRPDFQSRFEERYESRMDEINDFYTAMQPRADEALREIEKHPFDAMPMEVARLFRLLMALAHVALSVERHKAPRPRAVVYPTTLRLATVMTPA